ncbi:MAG: glycosyltransferase family 4 protein [Victivallales bacterium]|nr:glycosyltransferase family 4 protein [Victivallales bacterium]
MMRLAFAIFKYYPFGGLERNFIKIAAECLARGHAVTIFTMRWDGPIPSALAADGCSIIKIPFSGLSNHARCASFAANLQRRLKDSQFDLIVGFNRMPGLDLYYCADVCYVADIRHRRSALHALTPRHRVYARFEKAVFSPESETAILALSDIQRDIYIREYDTPSERFFQVPAGIDQKLIRAEASLENRTKKRGELGLEKNTTMLLMIGSDFRRKGVDRAVEALAALSQEERRCVKLVVAGKGREHPISRLAESLRVGENVLFLGAVDDIPRLLSAADLLLHPARAENTGNAIVEALTSGVPVLTLLNCGYAWHVEKSGAGKVLDGWDFSQSDFNAGLAELLNATPDEKAKLRGAAARYSDATDFHSRPQVVADIIAKLAEERKRGKKSDPRTT